MKGRINEQNPQILTRDLTVSHISKSRKVNVSVLFGIWKQSLKDLISNV